MTQDPHSDYLFRQIESLSKKVDAIAADVASLKADMSVVKNGTSKSGSSWQPWRYVLLGAVIAIAGNRLVDIASSLLL